MLGKPQAQAPAAWARRFLGAATSPPWLTATDRSWAAPYTLVIDMLTPQVLHWGTCRFSQYTGSAIGLLSLFRRQGCHPVPKIKWPKTHLPTAFYNCASKSYCD